MQILSEFRTRLVTEEGGAPPPGYPADAGTDAGMAPRVGANIADSTHVLAAMRVLNRLERVGLRG